MNLILHYWFLAPSLCIALATAYFTYRVLIGYVSTPERAVKRAYEARVSYVLGRINKNNERSITENTQKKIIDFLDVKIENAESVSEGYYLNEIKNNYIQTGVLETRFYPTPKEVEVNLLEAIPALGQTDDDLDLYEWTMRNVYQLPPSPKPTAYEILGKSYAQLINLPGTPACYVDKSYNMEGSWIFEPDAVGFLTCTQKPKNCNDFCGVFTEQEIRLKFPKYKYECIPLGKINGRVSLLGFVSREDYFAPLNGRRNSPLATEPEHRIHEHRIVLAEPESDIIDKSCNVEGVWVFEKYRGYDRWRCKEGRDKGNVGGGYIDLDLIIAHFPKHKYTWDKQDMLNGEHLWTITSRKDYFGAKNGRNV